MPHDSESEFQRESKYPSAEFFEHARTSSTKEVDRENRTSLIKTRFIS